VLLKSNPSEEKDERLNKKDLIGEKKENAGVSF